MYGVVINTVEGQGANYQGRGSTIQAAVNRAKAEMEESYGRGVATFTFSAYKENDRFVDGWEYLWCLTIIPDPIVS